MNVDAAQRQHDDRSTLPYLIFSTDELPLADRTRAWQEIAAPLFEVMPRETTLEGRINSFLLSDWLVGTIECNAHRYSRQPSMSANDGLDYYFIQHYQQGELKGTCGDNTIELRPGDIGFFDTKQAIDVNVTSVRTFSLIIPRHEFGIDPASTNLHGMVLKRESPMGYMLGNHFQSMLQLLPTLPIQDAKQLKSCTRSLMVAWLDTLSSQQTRSASTLRGLKQQLHAFIDERLSDPALDPALLQREFGISRTTLYRAFGAPGVSDYIRYRRLEAALRDIKREEAMSISQIAFRWGFTNERKFQRAFRKRYDMSPSDARHDSKDLLQLHSPVLALQDTMAYWVKRGKETRAESGDLA
ncbi:helix-turn-helix domain-containing protein [Franzmannia qiaohouensis]|uniref:Helix-turn-helix domain-containing protein n=1 Tax=Franzmannia qiaohouensis TaxID=1329370 RepID=A0ABU1HJB9_9GAMM|nr:helix-turn-helix domain-containing protein [Halomonas qiaohouensis]MDR5907391.1 helix-turn-helix domain-containing protein [Halomonas qiaohouensis]